MGPNLGAKTLEQAIGSESEWFDDQRLSKSPDLEVWPFLFTYRALKELVEGKEWEILANHGIESATRGSGDGLSQSAQTLFEPVRLLLTMLNSLSVVLYWTNDGVLIMSSATGHGLGYIVYLDQELPDHTMQLQAADAQDILNVVLETWRRGGVRSAGARKWLCDAVHTAIIAERSRSSQSVGAA